MAKKAAKASPAKCAITGRELPAGELLRFVIAPDGLVVLDLHHALPGQSLWLVASAQVLQQAQAKDVFQSLHSKAHTPADFAGYVEAMLRKRLAELLHLAKRSGTLIGGYEKVRSVLMNEEAQMLLQAHDASERGRSKLANMAKAQDVPVVTVLSRAELETVTGRDNQVHLVLKASGLNTEIDQLSSWLLAF